MSLKKEYPKRKQTCKVTFSYPKEAHPEAKEIRVLGDFNEWNWEKGTPLKPKNGTLVAEIPLKKNCEYQFRYALDNESWDNDWEADDYVPSPYGVDNCVVRT